MEPASSNGNLYPKDSSSSGSQNKLYLLFSVLTFCLAFAAFIIAIVSVSRNGTGPATINISTLGSEAQSGAQTASDDDKVWLLHIGHGPSNIEYIDEEDGIIKGFNPDFCNAVCRIANKNCKVVFDIYSNCWDHKAGETARGGFGLMAGWYDSCAAWYTTTERRRTFAFSDEFTRSPNEVFATLPGNEAGFDWRNLTDKKIGFIDGFSSDEHCIARADGIVGNQLTSSQLFHYADYQACVDALVAKDVDALFLSTSTARGRDENEIEIVSGELNICKRPGFGMMTRYDSKLIEWWNPAQEKLIASKEYEQICQDVKEVHGHISGLDPADFCL